MTHPTAAEIRVWSQVPFEEKGYPEADPDPLDVIVARASALFEQITGRPIDATMPPQYDPLVQMVVQRMVELLVLQSQPENVETAADFMLLASFSAGAYSETRRSLAEVAKGGGLFLGDPSLTGLMFSLMTPEQADYWFSFLTGQNAPAWEVTQVDWDAYNYPYGWPPSAIEPPRGDGGW